jgi:hypothetical protein
MSYSDAPSGKITKPAAIENYRRSIGCYSQAAKQLASDSADSAAGSRKPAETFSAIAAADCALLASGSVGPASHKRRCCCSANASAPSPLHSRNHSCNHPHIRSRCCNRSHHNHSCRNLRIRHNHSPYTHRSYCRDHGSTADRCAIRSNTFHRCNHRMGRGVQCS